MLALPVVCSSHMHTNQQACLYGCTVHTLHYCLRLHPATHDECDAGSGREWAAEEAAYGGHVQQALL